MKINSMDIYIFPLENVHCGYGIQQGVVMPSLSYIPGRVIRGGLAGWAVHTGRLKNTDSLFDQLFLPDANDSRISFPFCTLHGRFQAPFSLFEFKGSSRSPYTALLEKKHTIYIDSEEAIKSKIESNCLDGPVDFLQRDIWPAELDITLKLCRGTVIEPNQYCPPFSTIMEMKSAHDEEKGRVKTAHDEEKGLVKTAGAGGLRVEEVMPGTFFSKPDESFYNGTLVFQDDVQVREIFEPLARDSDFLPFFSGQSFSVPREKIEDPKPGHLIFIGRRKIPAAIFAKAPETVDTDIECWPEKPQIGEDGYCSFTVSITADYIPPEKNVAHWESVEETNKIKGAAELFEKKVFCRRGLTHGYNTITGSPLLMATIAAGSCGRFDALFEKEKIPDFKDLRIKSLLGMGRHVRDGFGRFKLNWTIHRTD